MALRFPPVFPSLIAVALAAAFNASSAPATRPPLTLAWTNNVLTVTSSRLPGGSLEILYLEAFCRSGSTERDWRQTTLPHTTRLVEASADGQRLVLMTKVQPNIDAWHEVKAGVDEVEFRFALTNHGPAWVDVNWFQPACIRVDRFTGKDQSNYLEKSFIFTKNGLTRLHQTQRREEALYRGGQVYVPPGIPLTNVNPRPLSPDVPVNGLIGCFSSDEKWLLATAWDRTHELFQGVYTCLHADPHIGGLAAGETKRIRGKLYLFEGGETELLARYRRDFPR